MSAASEGIVRRAPAGVLPDVLGAAAAVGLGMIPLHHLPRTVRAGVIVLPAALAAGTALLTPQRAAPRTADDGLEGAPSPRIPTCSEGALALELEDGALDLLTDADPMAFTPGRRGGTPADEYRPEARCIAEILRTDGAITTARLDEVWHQWFDETLTPLLGEERSAALAAALTALTSPQSAR